MKNKFCFSFKILNFIQGDFISWLKTIPKAHYTKQTLHPWRCKHDKCNHSTTTDKLHSLLSHLQLSSATTLSCLRSTSDLTPPFSILFTSHLPPQSSLLHRINSTCLCCLPLFFLTTATLPTLLCLPRLCLSCLSLALTPFSSSSPNPWEFKTHSLLLFPFQNLEEGCHRSLHPLWPGIHCSFLVCVLQSHECTIPGLLSSTVYYPFHSDAIHLISPLILRTTQPINHPVALCPIMKNPCPTLLLICLQRMKLWELFSKNQVTSMLRKCIH